MSAVVPPWPAELDAVWAKSPGKGEQRGESLPRHTWNVLEKLAQGMRLRPNLPERLGFPALWHCLFWACWLHDFGKAAQGFQRMVRTGVAWPHRHEVLSLAFLAWVGSALTDEECRWVAAAIVSHHRDADDVLRLYMDPPDPEDDPLIRRIEEIDDLAIGALWCWLHECSSPWVAALAVESAGVRVPALPERSVAVRQLRVEGARTARRWLQAYRRWVRGLGRSHERALVIGTLALRGYAIRSDHAASAHAPDLPHPTLVRPPELLARLGLAAEDLHAHQRDCARTEGSAVLTAPTGSGKTEAALLWACAQSVGQRTVPRLFYTLPFQASLNAMHDRLSERAFPGQVGLEHSRATLALYRRWLDEDYGPKQAARLARWGTDLARLNHFPVRVLSPYQLLKAPYRLRGYEVLLADLFDAAIVLDEVHAYEAERLALILAMVRYLRTHFGARCFVMSATLPGLLRERLVDALGEYTPVRAAAELVQRFRRHLLRLLAGDLLDPAWLARIAEVARGGASVLVCCNTVRRAQLAFDELDGRLQGIDVVLLHGRFNGKHRLQREIQVRQATGSRSKDRRPIVLVATQVVEVSLDIDLDVIYTDPAPLEALIQRFGRVNRRRLREAAPVYVFDRPTDGQGVYNAELVRRAIAVLSKHADRMIDEESVSDWLDEVYEGEVAARWNQDYARAHREFEAGCLASLRAFDSDDRLETAFYQAFDSIEVLPSCLEGEYRQLAEDEPLEASQLLVPLRWSQVARLHVEGKVRADARWRLKIVDVPYSKERGLQLP
ncbi:MAG: CRISPR-associated helicase Cas3' [Chloroflexi bacterium]|nr:CRISPR-associated helicase Cas3' [Chloroflexota bacterium]